VRLAAYTPGEQPSEHGIVKLNTNENPYPPSPKVRAALRSMDMDRLRRYPNPVSQELRAYIARMHGCKPSQVFAGNGSDEILALCTRAFVEDNGSIGYFEPSYSLYPVLADIRCAEKRPVELGCAFEWRMPANYRCSLFFLANPNAPTGILYPRDTVAEFCRKFRGLVLVDEAYVDFSSANCMGLARELPNVLVMRTLSKSYSLAGLRVGYVVGADPLIQALFKLKDSYNLDAISQRLALAALKDRAYMLANVRRIKATRQRLTKALRDRGWKVYPSETNFLWARPARTTAKTLFEALRRQLIFVRYFAGKRTGACIRITVGTDAQVDRLIEAVATMDGKGKRA
jgi:histidinol-phosphate aminotransferase